MAASEPAPMTDDAIEAVAKALALADNAGDWLYMREDWKAEYRVYARAAIAAMPAPQQEPGEVERLRDAAENAVIAFGMGWDMEGVIEVLRAALRSTTGGEHE